MIPASETRVWRICKRARTQESKESCYSLSLRVFRRDLIYNDLVLFQIIGVGGVRHQLKASGMTRTNYLLLKHYKNRDFILKLVSYSIGPFWHIFLFNIIGMSLKQIMTPALAARRRTLLRVCKESARKISYHFSSVLTVEAPCVPSCKRVLMEGGPFDN